MKDWEATRRVSGCLTWCEAFNDLGLAVYDYLESGVSTQELREVAQRALAVIDYIVDGKRTRAEFSLSEESLVSRFAYHLVEQTSRDRSELSEEVKNEFPVIRPTIEKLVKGQEQIQTSDLNLVFDFSEVFADRALEAIQDLNDQEMAHSYK